MLAVLAAYRGWEEARRGGRAEERSFVSEGGQGRICRWLVAPWHTRLTMTIEGSTLQSDKLAKSPNHKSYHTLAPTLTLTLTPTLTCITHHTTLAPDLYHTYLTCITPA